MRRLERREDEAAAGLVLLRFPKNRQDLRRQWHPMVCTHLHLGGWDKADFRIGANGQLLFLAVDSIFQAPQLPARRPDNQEKPALS